MSNRRTSSPKKATRSSARLKGRAPSPVREKSPPKTSRAKSPPRASRGKSPRKSSPVKARNIISIDEIFQNQSGKSLIDNALAVSDDMTFQDFVVNGGLIILIYNGDLQAIKYLYELRPELVKNINGKIYRAVIKNKKDILKYLLSIQKYDSFGIIQLLNYHAVIGSDIYGILFDILDEEGKRGILEQYIFKNNLKGVNYVLDKGLDRKNLDEALKYARYYPKRGMAKVPNQEIIDMLLNAGARPGKDETDLWPLPKLNRLD